MTTNAMLILKHKLFLFRQRLELLCFVRHLQPEPSSCTACIVLAQVAVQ